MRSTMVVGVLATLVAAMIGCGDDGASNGGVDSGPDIDGSGGGMTVTLHAYGAKLLAVRSAGGEWQQLEVPASGDVDVTLPETGYTAVTVCDQPGYFNYFVIQSGPDERELDIYCDRKPDVQVVTVSLAANSTAEPYILGIPLAVVPSWDFEVGVYDIVTYDRSLATPRYQIERDVTLDTSRELAFDLATTGMTLEPYTITTDASGDETVTAMTRVATPGRARASFLANGGEAWRIPAAGLGASDYQAASATARAGNGSSRSTMRLLGSGTTATLALPPPVTATASWQTAPQITFQSSGMWNDLFFYTSDSSFTKLFDVYIHPAWIAAMGPVTELAFPDPSTLPGWRAEWNITDHAGWDWSLGVSRHVSEHEEDRANLDGTF